MPVRQLQIAAVLISYLTFSLGVLAADRSPRNCSLIDLVANGQTTIPPGGIGGTGNTSTIPPGGIGGTGHESTIPGGIGGTGQQAAVPPGGIGGTGHETKIPPGEIGGTGITLAGNLNLVSGTVIAEGADKQKIHLVRGDAICLGDKISLANDAKAKIMFSDGATLYLLKNAEISIDEYYFAAKEPKLNRSLISLSKGDIRSVSGSISKLNPKNYSFKTPLSTISVIGTDFLVTHLPHPEGAVDAGTYTKVISGEVSVQSSTSTIRLRANESSHVMLNGSQSIISSGGGSCSP
jgi:hypothetical protein